MSDISMTHQTARRLAASLCAARASTRVKPGQTPTGRVSPNLTALLSQAVTSSILDRMLDTPLDPSMRFKNFAVGPSNRKAFSAARRCAMQAAPPHNPLYILSGAGNGRTHLLQAAVRRRRKLFPQRKALYTSADMLALEYAEAERRGHERNFQSMLCELDLLAIDDAQGLAAADSGQRGLAGQLAELMRRGGALMFAANRPPDQLELDKALIKLLRGAHLAPILAPEAELRLAALEQAVAEEKRRGRAPAIEPRALKYLARELPVSFRVLRAALQHLTTIAETQKRKVSVATIEEELGDFLRSAQRRRRLETTRRPAP